MKDKFADFCCDQKDLFIIIFSVIVCLILTPINLMIAEPIQKTFNIPETFEVHDQECTGFGYFFSSCKQLETTHQEKSIYTIIIVTYLIEIIIAATSGYYLNKKLVKVLG